MKTRWKIPLSPYSSKLLGNTKGKYSPGITPDITPGMYLLRAQRVMTLTLNFLKGDITKIYSWGDFTLKYIKFFL